MDYPLKIKSNSKFIEELRGCEHGRYEDAIWARAHGEPGDVEAGDYECVVGDFIDRWKSQIEVRNEAELCELYYALASGTIGLYYCPHANTLLNQIRPIVDSINPALVEQWPVQDCM